MATLRILRSVVSKTGRGRACASMLTAPTSRTFSALPLLQDWEDIDDSVLEGNDDMLCLRSYAMHSSQFKFRNTRKAKPFDTFLRDLPTKIAFRQEKLAKDALYFEEKEDPVLSWFHQMKLTQKDWAPYAHFDPTKAYTRNLICTDNETYTLLLLCWNPDVESKIHDHPCDGCWLQVLKGQVQESRYVEGKDGYLQCTAEESFQEGQVAFINDSIGLHKIGNPSKDTPAVTLHLYHPPFQKCRVWDSDSSSSSAKASCATHFSEYGWVEGSHLP